jgi:hypothetical protein
MTPIRFLIVLPVLSFVSQAVSQEAPATWTVQPTLALGKFFPGVKIEHNQPPTQFEGEFIFRPPSEFQYEGTSLGVAVRLYPPWADFVALTLGGGITWFYESGMAPVTSPVPADDGIGQTLIPGEFIDFPLTAGIQLILPAGRAHDFAVHAGLDLGAHFISGNVEMKDQIHVGYGISCGFAVKVFEFGLKYQAFSDMKNLGAYGGIRFTPFEL